MCGERAYLQRSGLYNKILRMKILFKQIEAVLDVNILVTAAGCAQQRVTVTNKQPKTEKRSSNLL